MTVTAPKIDNPELWRLSMLAGIDGVDVLLSSSVNDSPALSASIAYDRGVMSPLKNLEDAVYANPWILADYGRTNILVDGTPRIFVPAGLDDGTVDASVELSALAEHSGPEGQTVVMRDVCAGMMNLWSLDAEVHGFLARTFHNIVPRHVLTPLCDYFIRAAVRGNSMKIYVYLSGGSRRRADIFAIDRGGHVRMITSINYATTDDCLYYVLACARSVGFDLDRDEAMVCGDAFMRDELMPAMRRFVKYVMPQIFTQIRSEAPVALPLAIAHLH